MEDAAPRPPSVLRQHSPRQRSPRRRQPRPAEPSQRRPRQQKAPAARQEAPRQTPHSFGIVAGRAAPAPTAPRQSLGSGSRSEVAAGGCTERGAVGAHSALGTALHPRSRLRLRNRHGRGTGGGPGRCASWHDARPRCTGPGLRGRGRSRVARVWRRQSSPEGGSWPLPMTPPSSPCDNAPTRERAEKYRAQVEQMLGEHFGTPVPLRLIIESEAGAYEAGAASAPAATAARPTGSNESPDAPTPKDATGGAPESQKRGSQSPVSQTPGAQNPQARSAPAATAPDPNAEEAELMAHVDQLEDADVSTSGIDKLTDAFPGAQLIETEESTG